MQNRFCRSVFATLWWTAVSALNAHALESGAVIPSGTENGTAPFALHAVISEPMGLARVSGAPEPDLFTRTGRFGRESGLFLHRFVRRGPEGQPVFDSGEPIGYPIKAAYPPDGHIVQTRDGEVHALWLVKDTVLHAVFDAQARAFVERNRIAIDGLPRRARHIGALLRSNGTATLLLSVPDGTAYRTWEGSTRDPDYDPYDGRGIWRGGMPYAALYMVDLPNAFEGPASAPRAVTPERDIRNQYGAIWPVKLRDGGEGDVVTGSYFGPFHYYRADGTTLEPRRHVVGSDGIALRHPSIHPVPVAYPNPESGWTDLIAGGEGGFYWYRFTGAFNEDGKPVFDDPIPVLETNAALYAGTLPVPNVVDWDGDGDQDIVAGNSEGFILFFENRTDDRDPQFLPGIYVEAAGEPIHVQPGYRLDIQGPNEARWGYVCPTVVDWNRDGLLDIVMSDSTARHTYFENVGDKKSPRLAAGKPIYYDGIELYGTWRVQPAAGELGDRMAYIALDDDDAFHLYWQQDARNVTDGGKLCLDTDEVIHANFLDAGGTGRLKIVLYDWDRDGKKDLIVGTPRHGSVPNPETGLPQSLGLPGAAVLFLRNTGTNEAPAFAFPQLFAHQGNPIFLGQHACGPAIADFGHKNGPSLIVGEEGGRLLYFAREHLTIVSANARRERPQKEGQ